MGSTEDTCISSSKMPIQRTTHKKKPTCGSSHFSKAPTLVGERHIRSLCFSFFLTSYVGNYQNQLFLSENELCHENRLFKWISMICHRPCFKVGVWFSPILLNHTSLSQRTEEKRGDRLHRRHLHFEQQNANTENNTQEKAQLC